MNIQERKNLVEKAGSELAKCSTGATGETSKRAELEKQVALLQAESTLELSKRVEEISNIMEKNEASSSKLQRSVFYLNIIICVVTVVGVAATIYAAAK
ncbi:hypothetical protein V8087_002612 [Vibrio vulnificus]|nr:hypothetical protein [Vibrio vulnificus]